MSLYRLLVALYIVLQIAIIPFTVYWIWITLPIFKKFPELKRGKAKQTRFLVLIAARDEANVIPDLLISLQNQNYPQELFDVWLIADNCHDETKPVAEKYGARVFERFNHDKVSKGYALDWIMQDHWEEINRYDALVFFDADNIIDPDFLLELSRCYAAGYRAVKGKIVGKNVDLSAWAGANALFFSFSRVMLDHPRLVRDLGVLSLNGTGFSIRPELLLEAGFPHQTLTEDVELSMQLALQGERITCCDAARCYDEQVENISQTFRQRIRWSYGSRENLRLFFKPMWQKFLQGAPLMWDRLCFLLSYAWVIQCGISNLLLLLIAYLERGFMTSFIIFLLSLVSFYLVNVIFIRYCVYREQIHWSGIRKAIFLYPLVILIAILSHFISLVIKKPKWRSIDHYRTNHKR